MPLEICPKCGTVNPNGAPQCTNCGAGFAPPPVQARPARVEKVSVGRKIVAALLGALAAGLFGSGFPVVATIVLGAIIGVLLVVRRPAGETDPAAGFIQRAAAREVIDETTANRLLLHRHWELRGGAPALPPPLEEWIPPPPAVKPPIHVADEPALAFGEPTEAPPVTPPPSRPPVDQLPPTPPPTPPPSPAERPWAVALTRVWDTFRSDLAVHGLAYLGVLFVFVGVVGFVVFAFRGVGSTLRPVAEITIPVALFGSARFLRGTGAPFVARSLELLGGLLTPVVLFAAFADGAPIPPDPDDEALVVTLTVVSLVLAAAYGWYARRRPESSLRYLVAPLLWTAAGVIGLSFDRGPSAAQFATVAVAVLATTLVARRFGDHPLGRASALVALAGVILAFGLVLLFAATSGWPAVPVLVSTVAVVVVADLRRHTIPMPWMWQLVAGVIGAVAITQTWDATPVAVGSGLLLLVAVEWWWHRGESDDAAIAAIGVYVATVLVSAEDPQWLFCVTAPGALWTHFRRIRPLAGRLTPLMKWGAAALPFVTAAALQDWAGTDVAWPIVTGLVVGAALVVRMVRHSDTYLMLWMIGAATLLLIGSASNSAHPAVLISMSAGAAAVFLLIARGPGFGVWAASVALGWTLLQTVWVFEVNAGWAPVALAVGGLAAVGWSSHFHRPRGGHVGAVGHLAGLAALGWMTDGWWLVAVLGASAAGVLWSLLVAERAAHDSSPLFVLLARVFSTDHRTVGAAFALAAAALIPVWLISILVASGLDGGAAEWWAVVASGCAVAAGAVTRLLHDRHHLGVVVAWSALGWAVIGASAAVGSRLPEMVSLALAVVAMAAMAPGLRHPPMTWTAWAATAGLTVSVARHSDIAPADLHRVVLVWGSLVLLAALSMGRRRVDEGEPKSVLGRIDLLPPIALGAVAALAATGVELVGPHDWAWTIGAAVVAGTAAILSSVGAISALGWGLLTVGAWLGLAEADWLTEDRVWPTAIWTGLLCVAAGTLRRITDGDLWWRRWDLPPFAVAHAAAVVGIVGALLYGDVPITWAGFGAVGAATAAVLRRLPWAAGAAALFIGASLATGGGWPTLTLLGLSAISLILAVLSDDPAAGILHGAGAAFAMSGWGAAIAWQGWWPDPAIAATAVGAGVIAIGLSAGVRVRPKAARSTAPWAVAALIAEMAAVITVTTGDRTQSGLGLAAGLALWALGLGLAAAPLRLDGLRDATVLPTLGSGLALIYARQPDAGSVAMVAAGTGLMLAVIGIWSALDRESVWSRSLLIGSASADVVAAIAALTLLPEVTALTMVLVAVGIKLLGVGVWLSSPMAAGGSVWSFAAAWLLFASEAAGGNSQWFALPVGIALAATADLVRWHARLNERATVDLFYVDGLAATLILGPSLVQTVQSSVAYGLLVMVLGVLLVGWGMATRVWRRLVIGGGGVVTGALLMLVVPLARIIPQFRGPALWATVIVLGMTLIGAAVGLERGRSTVRLTMQRLRDLTEGWE